MFKRFKADHYVLYLLTLHIVVATIFWIFIFEILGIG